MQESITTKQDMNTVFFIGNGFDINLGMETRYSDFYRYYKDIESSSDIIKKLKEEIAEGIVNWSDLELAFGKYTIHLKDLEEFDEVYEDIVNNLAEYLVLVEEKTDLKAAKVEDFLKDLILPENYLADEDIQELRTYRSNWSTSEWHVNIITLNYTKSIERLMNGINKSSPIGTSTYGHNVYYKNIEHIHGFTNNRLVLGLNDISQIDNVNFHEKEEIVEGLIKVKCNQVQRHNIDKKCERLIEGADIICIFGSSIGDTDNHWWQLIGSQLRRHCRIIIFSRGENIKERFAQKAARSKRSIISLFLNKTNLSHDEIDQFKRNIYVGMNTHIFDIM